MRASGDPVRPSATLLNPVRLRPAALCQRLTSTVPNSRVRWGGETQEHPSGTADSPGTARTGDSGASVEEQLLEVYTGSLTLDLGYAVVGLGVVVGWWLLVGGLSSFLTLIGILALWIVAGAARTAFATRNWPTTEAVVRESKVLTLRELVDRAPGLTTTGSTSGGYVPFVRYEYSVNGETYVNARVSPFDGSTIRRRRRAERITDNYVENTRVTVQYDPGDPSRTFLRSWSLSKRLLYSTMVAVASFVPAIWLAIGPPIPVSVDVAAIFAAFGGLFGLVGFYVALRAARTYRWPTTEGVIQGRDVNASYSSDEGSTKSYYPKLRYEYEVDGATYVSTGVRSGEFSSRSEAREWVEENYGSDVVTVHYSPRRPDRSVLEPGGVLGGIKLLVVGAAFLAVALAVTGNLPLPPVEEVLRRLPLEHLLRS